MKIDAIQIKKADNVATSLRDIQAGEEVTVGVSDATSRITILENIPHGHKFAVRPIPKGETILKYGEVIGRATQDIATGKHAHVQNIESLRGRGDWGAKSGANGI